MPTQAQLMTAVSNLLAAAGATGVFQLSPNARDRAFEAYVMALMVDAVRRAGGTVEIWGVKSGPNPNPLVFRGGPGHLGSKRADFAYAKCSLAGTAFEIHVDVEYQGTSGATHEIDISLVDEPHANQVRAARTLLPKTRHVRFAVECKCYNSRLGTVLGRVFVGLVSDCGHLEKAAFVTNGVGDGLAKLLTAKNNIETFFLVSPLQTNVEERFISVFETALRKWLQCP